MPYISFDKRDRCSESLDSGYDPSYNAALLNATIRSFQLGDKLTVEFEKPQIIPEKWVNCMSFTLGHIDAQESGASYIFVADGIIGELPIIHEFKNDAPEFVRSDLYGWLNSSFKECLPEHLSNILDKPITIPSSSQVFDTSYSWMNRFHESDSYDYILEPMQTRKGRIAVDYHDDLCCWWLANRHIDNDGPIACFAMVGGNGEAYYRNAALFGGIRPVISVNPYLEA